MGARWVEEGPSDSPGMLFLMDHPRARTEEGSVQRRVPFAFVEFAFGISIVVVLTSLLLTHLAVKYTTTRVYRDEVFAYSAAKSILFELHALANGADLEESFDMERYDDGQGSSPTLCVTERGGALVPPDDLSSRNVLRDGQWVWSRRIDVRPLAGVDDPHVRYVTVQISRKDQTGIEQPVASLSSVINTPAGGNVFWIPQRTGR